MSQSVIHRGKRGTSYLQGGTQYIVGGALTFSGATAITLKQSIFPATGQYVLFDYSAGTFSGNQSTLDTNVLPYVNDSDLSQSSVGSLIDLPLPIGKIILTLQSRADNGMQIVEGSLDVSAGVMNVTMKKSLYKTAGVYHLFYFTAPGGAAANLIGPVTNIQVTVPPAGRTVVLQPYINGNYIDVQLA